MVNCFFFFYHWLVVTGTMEFWMTFHSVGNFIIPTDEVHHFSEGLKQPTSDHGGLNMEPLKFHRDFVRLGFKGTTKKARKYWCHRTIQSNHVNTYTFNNSNQKFIGLAFLGKSKRKPLCFTTNSLVFYRVFLTFCSLQPIEGNPMIYGWNHQKLGKMWRNMKQYLVGGLEHVFP